MDVEKRGYASKQSIGAWSKNAEKGLNPSEKYLVENFTNKKGNFLVLKSSSGRESLALAKIGFVVTGIEWVRELIDIANKKAEENGAEITYIQGDVYHLEKLSGTFDYAILSANDYSSIISRKSRIEWLKKLKKILNTTGKAFLNYVSGPPSNLEKRTYGLNKFIAFLTLGNFDYQLGDMATTSRHPLHRFFDHNEVAREAEEAGFKIIATGVAQEKSAPWIVLGVGGLADA